MTQAVYQLQAQVEASIVRIKAEEATNIKKLSRTYAAMSPEGAAPILKEMEEATLIKILALMKETESAPIFEAMSKLGPDDAKRVAKVTERLRFYLSQPKDAKSLAMNQSVPGAPSGQVPCPPPVRPSFANRASAIGTPPRSARCWNAPSNKRRHKRIKRSNLSGESSAIRRFC